MQQTGATVSTDGTADSEIGISKDVAEYLREKPFSPSKVWAGFREQIQISGRAFEERSNHVSVSRSPLLGNTVDAYPRPDGAP